MFTPLLVYEPPGHTRGKREVKIPTPPRIWVDSSPLTSRLKPIRGETLICAFGICPALAPCISQPAASRVGIVTSLKCSSTFGFVGNIGISKRIPAVTFRFSFTWYSSCAYSPNCIILKSAAAAEPSPVISSTREYPLSYCTAGTSPAVPTVRNSATEA